MRANERGGERFFCAMRVASVGSRRRSRARGRREIRSRAAVVVQPAATHPSVHRPRSTSGVGRSTRGCAHRCDARAGRDEISLSRAVGGWGARGRGVEKDEAAAVLFIHSLQEGGNTEKGSGASAKESDE